jgi:phytoene synthase
MSFTLEQSRDYCHLVMRRAAGNFYHGMRLLPDRKRSAMHALYAWMRHIDDIADGPDDAVPDTRPPAAVAAQLEQWRELTHLAIAGAAPAHPLLPALAEAMQAFAIPPKLLDEAIDGQLQDLRQTHYHTFPELYSYCYRVASTVGIAAACIWRVSHPSALKLAEYRGIAFQLTNILRDVREDSRRGRVYLPQEDLRAFGFTTLERPSAELAELLLFEAQRAREYYEKSAPLEGMVAPDSRATLRIMTAIYRELLARIESDPLAVLAGRVSLSTARKLGEVVRQLYLDQKGAGA